MTGWTDPGPPAELPGKTLTISTASSSAYEFTEALPQAGGGLLHIGRSYSHLPGQRLDGQQTGIHIRLRVERSQAKAYRTNGVSAERPVCDWRTVQARTTHNGKLVI